MNNNQTEKLIIINEDIKKLKIKKDQNDEQLLNLRDEKQIFEMAIEKEVFNAVDDKGKPLHSNESKRKLAVDELLKSHNEHRRLCDLEKSLNKSNQSILIELDYLQRRFQIEKYNCEFQLKEEL